MTDPTRPTFTAEELTLQRDEARKFGEDAARKYNELLAEHQRVTCAFCGQEYPRGTPRHGDGQLVEHIRICEKHPMRELEQQAAAQAEQIAQIRTWATDVSRLPLSRDYAIAADHVLAMLDAAGEK